MPAAVRAGNPSGAYYWYACPGVGGTATTFQAMTQDPGTAMSAENTRPLTRSAARLVPRYTFYYYQN